MIYTVTPYVEVTLLPLSWVRFFHILPGMGTPKQNRQYSTCEWNTSFCRGNEDRWETTTGTLELGNPHSTDPLVQRTHKWPEETTRRKSKVKATC